MTFRTYKPQNVVPQPYVRTRPMTSSQAQAGAAALARQEERSKQTKSVKPSVGMSRIKTPVRTSCESKLCFFIVSTFRC